MVSRWAGGLGAAVALLAGAARAAPTAVDMTEHIFGASNTNAAVGHGALTAGVAADGDLTVLSWPSPSYFDQLAYVSGNDLDVRTRPHMGAPDGMGSMVGLLVDGTLVWLRDLPHSQRYTRPDAPVVETTFTHKDFTVALTDVVSPDADVLTRRVVLTRAKGSLVSSVKLVVYENLSPTLSKIPMIPFGDNVLDARNDFLALWDRAARVIVHVHPNDRAVLTGLFDIAAPPETVSYGPADALMQQPAPSDAEVDALVAAIDTAFPPGVAALVTTEPAPAEHQVGSDATPICAAVGRLADNLQTLPQAFPGFKLPLDSSLADALRCTDPLPAVRAARKWQWAPEDALGDLTDKKLSGSRIAACQTNGALVAPLPFQGDVAEGSVVFAFGASVARARAELGKAAAIPAAARQAGAEKAARDALGSARLPDSALGTRVVQVAQRALVNMYVARDRRTGAIVASISRQPPYFLDWPRDGAFFGHAIDVAGVLPWFTQRGRWYATLQRREAARGNPLVSGSTPVDPDTGEMLFPAFAWEMNYYADGPVGGNIRFEIDNTALHLWATVVHAAALRGAERGELVARVWPTFKDALHLLVRWRDPKTGLQAPANEDDHLELTSTLHGAVTVYAALVAGARLAHLVGDGDAAQEALSRALELQKATLTAYWDPKAGLFRDTPQIGMDYIPGTRGTGATAWLAWPARLLDPEDPRLEAQLAADMQAVMRDIHGETEGGAYVMKNVLSAALLGKDGGSRDAARDAVEHLADIATPDTLHFGEVWVTTHPSPGTTVTSQRVAPPHVWEGTLFYLAAMALSAPQTFDPQIAELPLPPLRQGKLTASGGCDCNTTASAHGGWWLAALAVLLLRLAGPRPRPRA